MPLNREAKGVNENTKKIVLVDGPKEEMAWLLSLQTKRHGIGWQMDRLMVDAVV
jgi:hypothetical protein